MWQKKSLSEKLNRLLVLQKKKSAFEGNNHCMHAVVHTITSIDSVNLLKLCKELL